MDKPIVIEACFSAIAILYLLFSFCKKQESLVRILNYLTIGIFIVFGFFLVKELFSATYSRGTFFVSTPLIIFSKLLVLDIGIIALCVMNGAIYWRDYIFAKVEFLVLFLFMITGSFLMISAGDFLSLYMSMELQAISLYVMLAFKKKSKSSIESAIKYFILSAVASGIFLYGISFIFGMTGTTNFLDIYEYFTNKSSLIGPDRVFGYIGITFILSGLLFKISLVPFHMWTPDVYEKSPTSIVLLLSTLSKVVGITVIINLLLGPFWGASTDWKFFFLILGLASIVSGSLAALMQTNIMRLLGFSSIANMGFVSLAIATGNFVGMEKAYFYLVVYIVMILGVFLLIIEGRYRLKSVGNSLKEIKDLSNFSKVDPIWSFMLSIFLFSLAGLPPLIGFFSKLYIIVALVSSDLIFYAIFAILFSVLGAFYYLRIVKTMYFYTPSDAIFIAQPLDLKTFLFFRLPGTVCLILTLFYVAYPDILSEVLSFVFKQGQIR